MMRLTLRAIFVVTLLVTAVLSFNLLVGAQEMKQTKGASATLSSSDKKFVMEAAHGGMMEVELGRLAAQKGAHNDVKQFGQRMVDDHMKSNQELMQLASTKGITLPSADDHATMNVAHHGTGKENHGAMDKNHHEAMKKHQKVMSKLTSLSGAGFDRAYMEMMVKDHAKAVALFEKEASGGGDADFKHWASEKLPTLRDHQQQARTIEAAVKGKTTQSSASKSSN